MTRTALVTAALAGALFAGALLTAPQSGAAVGDPRVTGTDVSTGSTTTTQRGSEVQWTLSDLAAGHTSASIEVTDPVPAGQTYVPGSLQVPPGWSGSVSAGVVHASGTAGASTQTTQPVAVPQPAFNTNITPGGGDGFYPIPFGDKVFVIYHHALGGSPIQCFDKVTRALCPGFPKAFAASPDASYPLFSTASIEDVYVDGAGHLYVPGGLQHDSNPINGVRPVIACLQLPSGDPCTTGAYAVVEPKLSIGLASGLTKIGDKLWTAVLEAGANRPTTIACVDLAPSGAMTPCAGYQLVPYGAILMKLITVAGKPVVTGARAGVPGYFPFNDQRFILPDATTPSQAKIGPASWPLVWLDNTGAPIGFCYHGYDTTPDACYDGTDATFTPKPWPAALTALVSAYPGVGSNYSFGYSPLIAGTKEYIPVWNHADEEIYGIKDSIVCFDWATQQPCADFGSGTTPGYLDTSSINGGHQHTYGMAQDDVNPQCGWAYGDAGQLFNFKLVNSANCGGGQTRATVNMDSTNYYCGDELAGHFWKRLSVTGITANQLLGAKVTVRDADGAVVPGFDAVALPADGHVDLSSIPTSGKTAALTAVVDLSTSTGDPWNNGGHPSVTLSFDGPAGTVCFRATNDESCTTLATAAGVTNTAHVQVISAAGAETFAPSAHLGIDPADPTNDDCTTTTPGSTPPTTTTPPGPSTSGDPTPSHGVEQTTERTTPVRVTSVATSEENLAYTGSPVQRLLMIGSLVAAAGAVLLLIVRRPSSARAKRAD